MTIDKSIFQKICDYIPVVPESLNRTFIFDGYEYYLNNHFGIRLLSKDKNNIDNSAMHITIIDHFKEWKINNYTTIASTDYAEIMKEFPVCTECDPDIKDSVFAECYECGGSGEVTLENDYNYYEDDCKSCNGTGQRRIRKGKYARHECPKCNGSGVWSEKTLAFPVGDHFINPVIIGFLVSIFTEIRIYDPGDDKHIFFSVDNENIEGIIGILNIRISDRESDYYKIVNPIGSSRARGSNTKLD